MPLLPVCFFHSDQFECCSPVLLRHHLNYPHLGRVFINQSNSISRKLCYFVIYLFIFFRKLLGAMKVLNPNHKPHCCYCCFTADVSLAQ